MVNAGFGNRFSYDMANLQRKVVRLEKELNAYKSALAGVLSADGVSTREQRELVFATIEREINK